MDKKLLSHPTFKALVSEHKRYPEKTQFQTFICATPTTRTPVEYVTNPQSILKYLKELNSNSTWTNVFHALGPFWYRGLEYYSNHSYLNSTCELARGWERCSDALEGAMSIQILMCFEYIISSHHWMVWALHNSIKWFHSGTTHTLCNPITFNPNYCYNEFLKEPFEFLMLFVTHLIELFSVFDCTILNINELALGLSCLWGLFFSELI